MNNFENVVNMLLNKWQEHARESEDIIFEAVGTITLEDGLKFEIYLGLREPEEDGEASE